MPELLMLYQHLLNLRVKKMTLRKLCLRLNCLVLLFCLAACKQEQSGAPPASNPAETKTVEESLNTSGGIKASTQAKIFRGNLGDANKIEMRLLRDGDQLSGTYSYLKIGSNLNLKGTIDKEGNITLREYDGGGKQTGVFKGKWSEKEDPVSVTIEGEWSKPDGGGEPLSFYLTEQHVEFSGGLKVVSREIKENNKQQHYRIDAEYPQIEGTDAAAVQAFNRMVSAMVTRKVKEWKGGAGRAPGEEDLTPDADDDSLDFNYNIRLATDDLISVEFNGYDYPHGAAHGSPFIEVVNYDLRSNKQLKLADLFQPRANYLQTISDYCIKDLKRQNNAQKPDERMLTDEGIAEGASAKAENYGNWNITAKGLLITFDSYQVGAYAVGQPEVMVPYAALKGILKPDGPVATLLK
jgi:hypothetical protein